MISPIYDIYPLALFTGILVKLTDLIIDDKKKIFFKGADSLFGPLYGLLIGIMISQFPIIAPLWCGIVIGNLYAKKFDGLGHQIALLFLIIGLLLFGFSKFSLELTIIIALLCVLEEKLNDFMDKQKKKGPIVTLLKYRPVMEISALIIAIIIGKIEFFFALFIFDIGYISTTLIGKKIK